MDLLLSRTLRRLRRVLRITAAWMAIGALTAFFHWAVLHGRSDAAAFINLLDHHVWRAMLWGLLGGGAYVFLLRDRLRHYAFMPAYAIMCVLLFLGLRGLDAAVPGAIEGDMGLNDPGFWLEYVYRALVVGSTMLAVRLYEQFGGSGFLWGDPAPRQELRIFMFLDMRSSTAIAEKIGNERYFRMLGELYTDIADPVADSQGSIYQYVGDEISVSWPLHKGLRHARCIQCFFAIRNKLNKRAAHYKKRYGTEPVFKAGFHYGHVTTGVVGLVKKQTVYSGDVVNTTAHIQARCNEYGVDNLVSKDLLDLLYLPREKWLVTPIGEISLKGKRHAVELAHVEVGGRSAGNHASGRSPA